MYQRGDLIVVPFPFTDLSSTKHRPALVISNNLVNQTKDLIAVMITSKDKEDTFGIEIENVHLTVPLPKKCFAKCHRLVTIDTNLIQKKIGEADIHFLDQVEQLIHTLICEQKIILSSEQIFFDKRY